MKNRFRFVVKIQACALAALAALGLASASHSFADVPPEEDRKAILAMAGEYEVIFNFKEVVALQPDYQLKEDYQETANEIVIVIKDTPEQIILQHILSVGSGKRIVKHWKQVWTWEDTRIVEYQGYERWVVDVLDPAEVAGTWSQLVTQVDDSPRYESYGKWRHDAGYSRWESGETNRPLPRREHTKRDDYQVLRAVNRQTITPHGWVHEQDNVKQIVDEEGNVEGYIAVEQGVNYYDKGSEEDFAKAYEYWENTSDFWAEVSEYWEKVEAEDDEFSITKKIEEDTLMGEMVEFAKAINEEGKDAPTEVELTEAIERFVN